MARVSAFVSASVRVAAAAMDFCVTVYDANEQIPGGFAYFFDETFGPLGESFSYCAIDASIDSRYGRWFVRHCETLAGPLRNSVPIRLPFNLRSVWLCSVSG